MAKLRMDDVDARPRITRDQAEADAQNTLYDGRKRLKTGKDKAIIFRTTEAKREQLLRLADALSLGRSRPVSMAETIEQAIDALEEKLKGGKI